MNLFNIENVKKITATIRKEPEPVSALTDAQQKIKDAVDNGSWGCQDRSVRALVEAITGVNCSRAQGSRPDHVQGSMIVFNDEILLVTRIDSDGDAMIFTQNGYTSTDSGTGTSYIGREGWRAATDEEIDTFFA